MISLQIADAIAEIRLCRAPVNALDAAMLADFDAALDKITASAVQVVLIHSDQKCFSAGADLAMINALFDAPDPQAAMAAYVEALHRVFDRLESLPAVTLAVIAGPALGGGLEFALACDLRLVAQDATLGLPEAAVGLLPGAGGTQRLARLCGPGIANRLILTAERISGIEAHRIGLAQYLAPRAQALDEARALAKRIAGLAPASLKAAKACIAKACIAEADAPERAGFALEKQAIVSLMGLTETRTRVEGFFTRAKS